MEAIESSEKKDLFYICALAIYQNDVESEGITIAQQLGPDTAETGTFATALKSASLLIVVITHVCDMNKNYGTCIDGYH